MKKFTKAQFSAATNEFVRLAKKFTENGFTSSVTFNKETTTIYIHDEDSCCCIFDVRIERYISRQDYNELVTSAKRANVTLGGHYFTMMDNVVKNDNTDNYYINF